MWDEIIKAFQNTPSRLKVVELLLEFGFSVHEDGIYAGPVMLPITKVAKAAKVDRKVVEETVRDIRKNEELMKVFKYLKPVADLSEVARMNKERFEGVIEIEAFSSSVGIAARATTLLAEEDLVIRYLLAKDPELSVKSTMTIVTDKKIPARILELLLRNKDVISVKIS